MTHKLTPYELALWAALPMAHTSRIEGRLKMILDTAHPRRALTRRVLMAALGIGAAVLVPLAMLRPFAWAQAVPSPKRHMTRAMAQVSAVSAVPGEFDAMRLVEEGHSLTPRAVADLERVLASRPDDYTVHIRLLGYYWGQKHEAGLGRAAYRQQVFWFIRNHPESVLSGMPYTMLLKREDPAGFEEGKTLWLEQVSKQPNNITLLGKAAGYFVLSDNQTAERLLRQAEALEPKNPQWPGSLGRVYGYQSEKGSPQENQFWARKALAEYEVAAALSTNRTLHHGLSMKLAMTAFDAGEYQKARRYASALLRRGEDDDERHAHMVMGRLALRDGDTAGAEADLLAMGRAASSPVLSSFGPNMRLAEDLLKAGRRGVVLAYFDECAKFWTMDNHQLAIWKAQVQKGEVPKFGGNLYY